MFQRKGSGSVSIIATVAGLAVMGVAGYNLMMGDCSSCVFSGSDAPTTTATTVATTSSSDKDGACALGGCSSESAPAAELVATTESADGACGADKLAEGACGLSQACGDKTADTADAQLVSAEAEPVVTPVAAAPGN